MQTNKIQPVNTTFGYNPELNAKLIHSLENAKKNKVYCSYLKDMCILTNNAEIDIREAEIKGKPYLYSLLIGVFLPVKRLLTNMIDSLYPQYNYRAKEIETYEDEIKECNLKEAYPGHWMNTLVEVLKADESRDIDQDRAYAYLKDFEKKFPDKKLSISVIGEDLTAKIFDDPELEDNEGGEEEVLSDLERRIKNGKSKVDHFLPSGAALKGFDGLGGMDSLKKILNNLVVDFLKHPKEMGILSKAYGVSLPDAILLYGPPGCGKTTIVEHMSTEADTALLKLKPGIFGSTFVSGNQQNLEAAFDYAASIATEDKPVILFIDDADSIIGSRDRKVSNYKEDDLSTFLDRIQNAHKDHVLVVAATNKYDNMDPAVMRRFTEQVFVGLPDQESRESIIKYYLSGDECNQAESLLNDNEIIKSIAQKMEGFPNSLIRTTMLKAKGIPFQEAKENMISTGEIKMREVTEQDILSIMELPEIQAQKVKEDIYQNKANRKSIGFSVGGKMLV